MRSLEYFTWEAETIGCPTYCDVTVGSVFKVTVLSELGMEEGELVVEAADPEGENGAQKACINEGTSHWGNPLLALLTRSLSIAISFHRSHTHAGLPRLNSTPFASVSEIFKEQSYPFHSQ